MVASYKDVKACFEDYKIRGRVIAKIRPINFDYRIQNLKDTEDIWNQSAPCVITTDEVCIVLEDRDDMEIYFSG